MFWNKKVQYKVEIYIFLTFQLINFFCVDAEMYRKSIFFFFSMKIWKNTLKIKMLRKIEDFVSTDQNAHSQHI